MLVVAAALAAGGKRVKAPVRFFASMVSRQEWGRLTDAHEEEARRKLVELRRREAGFTE